MESWSKITWISVICAYKGGSRGKAAKPEFGAT